MGDAWSTDGLSSAGAKTFEAANAAVTSAPERTKSRRENRLVMSRRSLAFLPGTSDCLESILSFFFSLYMRRPALLVLAPPHLHGFVVALDAAVFRVEMQFPADFPCNVGELQHGHRDIAHRNRSVELLPFADSRDKVREVCVGHGIGAEQVSRRGCSASPEFACLVPFQVVNLVAVAIDQHGAGGSHDCRTTIAAVVFHPLATLAFPGNHLIFVLKTRDQRVIELPVVLKVISAAGRGNPLWIVDSQSPAADIHLMCAVVKRFSSAIDSEPVPVVGLHIIRIGAARHRALPQVPIKLLGNGSFFASANRFPHIAVPGFGKVRPTDNTLIHFFDYLYGVRRRALLCAHLHQHLLLVRLVPEDLFF